MSSTIPSATSPSAASAISASTTPTRTTIRGSLRVAYQFNIGGSVRLDKVVAALTSSQPGLQPQRGKLQTSRRIPKDFGYGDDPPVRIDFRRQQEALDGLGVSGKASINDVRFVIAEVTFYEFGVLEVVLEHEFQSLALNSLIDLRAAIADENQSEPLYSIAEALMRALADMMGDAILAPLNDVAVEDYVIIVIADEARTQAESRRATADAETQRSDAKFDPATFVADHRADLSRLAHGDTLPHSPSQITRLVGPDREFSVYTSSVTFVNYYSTVIVGVEDPDVSDVVLIVCAQGLELQYLTALAEGYEAQALEMFSRRVVTTDDYHRIQSLTTDLVRRLSTVRNAVNLIGDPDLKALFQIAILQLDVQEPLRELRKSVQSMSQWLNTDTNIQLAAEVAKYDRWILVGVALSCLLSLLYLAPMIIKWFSKTP